MKKKFTTKTGESPEGVKSRVYLKAWAGADDGAKAKYQFKMGINQEPSDPNWRLKHVVFDKIVEIKEKENTIPFQDEVGFTVYDKEVSAKQKDGTPIDDSTFDGDEETPTNDVVNRLEAKNFMDNAKADLRTAAEIAGKANKWLVVGTCALAVAAAGVIVFLLTR